MNKIEIFNIQAIQKINFGNTGKQYRTFAFIKENTDSFEKKPDNKTVKKIATITGIATIISGAVLLVKSGKFEKFRKTPINMNIEEFKQKGAFKNGIARLKGKLFTGTITVNNKNGDITTLTYDKGKITQSLKTPAKENRTMAEGDILKEYFYKPDGRKVIIQKEIFKSRGVLSLDFELTRTQTAIFPDKSNLSFFGDGKKKGTVFINGKPKAVEIKYNYDIFDKYGHEPPMSSPYELNAIDLKTRKRLPKDEECSVISKLIELSDVNNNWHFYSISDSAFQ